MKSYKNLRDWLKKGFGNCISFRIFGKDLRESPFNFEMKDYKKYYLLAAVPEEVYHALTIPATIQLWTGETAEMSLEPGSEFSLWEGSIVGKNIEFVSGRKIVQEWYFGEQGEPSIVTIVLHPHKQGTSVELIHTNIPDEDYENIVQGWDEAYFGSLQEFYS